MLPIKRFCVHDVLVMKKHHACGERSVRFEVLAVGSDIKLRCLQCGHAVVVPRVKLEKNIRQILPCDGGIADETDKKSVTKG